MRYKKRTVAVVGSAAAIAAMGSTAAFAYFTSTGTGTSGASVGTTSNFVLTADAPSVTPLYPGGTVNVGFNINNPGGGPQAILSLKAAIAQNKGNIIDNSTSNPVNGCLASWFTAGDSNSNVAVPTGLTGPSGNELIANGNADVQVPVTMTDPNVDQSKCAGHTPQVTLTVNPTS